MLKTCAFVICEPRSKLWRRPFRSKKSRPVVPAKPLWRLDPSSRLTLHVPFRPARNNPLDAHCDCLWLVQEAEQRRDDAEKAAKKARDEARRRERALQVCFSSCEASRLRFVVVTVMYVMLRHRTNWMRKLQSWKKCEALSRELSE